MTARTTACTRWWGDGAVRGLVLGLLYPLAPAVVGGIVDSFEWGAAVALFGVLVGAFLGPAAGLAVGVVCSLLHPLFGAAASRRTVGLAGIAATALLLTGLQLAAAPFHFWTWAMLIGGPAATGVASLALWPLDER